MMNTHTHRMIDVPVRGGSLRVGVFEPQGLAPDAAVQTVLAIHGVTASHLAWLYLADELSGVRIIAPDLRGRGGSNGLEGLAGMRSHAADLVAVLDALSVERTVVMGHSMGGFVGLVLAQTAPERVSNLILVDGGLPLAPPPGVSAEALVEAILGPTAARLSMTFATTDDYLEFWRQHPAFETWDAALNEYFAYDLVDTPDGLRPATSLAVTTEDTIDLNTGIAITDAHEWLGTADLPVTFVSVPRGLQNEEPGLYPPEHLAAVLSGLPHVRHHHVDGFNHYTIVMSEAGARVLATLVQP